MKTQPERLGVLIKAVQHRQHRAIDKILAPLKITIVQWGALRQIAQNPEASQHVLATLTFNSDQAFGTLSQRLLKLKLIERHQGAGRAIIHSLTPLGEKTLKQCDRLAHKAFADLFAPLNESDRAAMANLLEKTLDWESDCPNGANMSANGQKIISKYD